MKTPKKWQNPDGTPKTCHISDCDADVAVAGLCGAHYHRGRRKEEVPVYRGWYDSDGKRMRCLHLGCDEPIEARGLCRTHYRQALEGKSPSERRPRSKWIKPDGTRMDCTVEGCVSPILSKGLCTLHYDREWKESHVQNNPETFCPIPDCGRRKTASALICGRCRQARWRYGLTDERYIEMMNPDNRRCSNEACRSVNPQLHIDHDHSCECQDVLTGSRVSCGKCVRGWLCRSCNLGLGYFLDDPAVLQGISDYVTKWKTPA